MNTEKLTAFVTTLNGKEGAGSHLVTVPPGPSLADALLSSPILAGEGGAVLGLGASDFDFGVDPSADPELALVRQRQRFISFFTFSLIHPSSHFLQHVHLLALQALRVSMEEQRQRQEDEARRTAVTSAAETGLSASAADGEKNVLTKHFAYKGFYITSPMFGIYVWSFLSVFGCRI